MNQSQRLIYGNEKSYWADFSDKTELKRSDWESWKTFEEKHNLNLNPPLVLLNTPVKLGVIQESAENNRDFWQIAIPSLGIYLELSERGVENSEKFWHQKLNSHRGFVHPVALILNSINLNAFEGSNLILISVPLGTWVIVIQDSMIQEIHHLPFDLGNEEELFIEALEQLVNGHLIPEIRFSSTPSLICLGAEFPQNNNSFNLLSPQNYFLSEDLDYDKLNNQACFLELHKNQIDKAPSLLSFNMEPLRVRELWQRNFKKLLQVSFVLLSVFLLCSAGFWGVAQGVSSFNKGENIQLQKELNKLEEVKLKLDSLEGQKNIFVELLSKRSNTNELLTQLSKKISKSTWISNAVINGAEKVDRIELEGYTVNEDALSEFMVKVAPMGKVQLLSTERIKGRSIVRKTGIRSNNKDIVKYRIEVLP